MYSWKELIAEEECKDYLATTLSHIEQRRKSAVIVYPEDSKVFDALSSTPFENVRVVIIGQDPYHGPNQAHGLCFSVLPGVKIPPSLANIYKELKRDIPGFQTPNHGYLQSWAEQGVLLLNTVLTVEQGQAHSHKKLGWEQFTDVVIQKLSRHGDGIIFLLWGAHAQKKGWNIDTQKHHLLTAPHPSPLSAHRGFLGCRHFSQTNKLLLSQAKQSIDWKLPAI